MIPDSVPLLVEAAMRALAAAVVLWAAMRLLRVENVLAQKAAWGLVLAAALAMPLLMRAPLLPKWAAVRIPAVTWHREPKAAAPAHAATPAVAWSAKPRAAHAKDVAESAAVPADDPEQYDAMQYDATQYDVEPRNAMVAPVVAAPIVAAPMTHASAPAAVNSRNWLVPGAWIAYLWVAGALLLRLLMGLASSMRLWMQAEPVDAAFESGIAVGVAVRASRRIASPVNIGSGIVLPADYAGWDEEKMRVVLAHEGSHVRQRDFYLQLAAGLYAAVTWFSPLGWWLRRRLSELGEAISDRAGMEAATSPSAYAQMLLEFAALPRPAYTGVAMAHSSNLSERIERLLNDSSFRRAFSGSRRALLVLVPAVLFATTALVHVQAARVLAKPTGTVSAVAPAAQPSSSATSSSSSSGTSQSAQSGQSHPAEAQVNDAQVNDEAQAPPAPPQNPDAAPAPLPAPAPKAPEDPEPGVIAVVPAPPAPPAIDVVVPVPPMPAIHVEIPAPLLAENGRFAYYSAFGDAYAVVGDPGTKVRYAGDWEGDRETDVEKARAQAHGHFLLFRHDDKTYFIDDAATVAQIEAMQKPMEDLGSQMRALGKQMRDEGQQEREAAREMERKAREAQMNIPTPDLTKEMAELNAAVAALKDKQGGTVTREQLGQIQRSIAELQRRVMSSEFKMDIHWDTDAMTKLNLVNGKYGQQMGELGKQMGELGRENNQKIKSIIDESLKDGKAKPVQ
jgi:beta-lactamase regulating signal transducer with metallopeptidase domain